MDQELIAIMRGAVHKLERLIQRVVVEVKKSGSNVACRVRDNGVGIDRERLARIFETGETDSPAGFGLGLSIVKRLVEAHGGTLRVESNLGEGASFLFCFPDPDV